MAKAKNQTKTNRHPVAVSLLALANKVDELEIPEFVAPEYVPGVDPVAFAREVLAAKAAHDAEHGDGKAQLRELLNSGFAEIIAEHDLSAKRTGAGRPPLPTAHDLSIVQKEEARRMIKEQGKTAEDIAAAYGVSLSSVRKEFRALLPKE